MTVQQFWEQVRLLRVQLQEQHPSGFLFVTGVADAVRAFGSGDSTEVSVSQAAKLIVTGSHRVSTADEVIKAATRAAQGALISQAAELRNHGQVRVILKSAA
jgi:hypothetical protein